MFKAWLVTANWLLSPYIRELGKSVTNWKRELVTSVVSSKPQITDACNSMAHWTKLNRRSPNLGAWLACDKHMTTQLYNQTFGMQLTSRQHTISNNNWEISPWQHDTQQCACNPLIHLNHFTTSTCTINHLSTSQQIGCQERLSPT